MDATHWIQTKLSEKTNISLFWFYFLSIDPHCLKNKGHLPGCLKFILDWILLNVSVWNLFCRSWPCHFLPGPALPPSWSNCANSRLIKDSKHTDIIDSTLHLVILFCALMNLLILFFPLDWKVFHDKSCIWVLSRWLVYSLHIHSAW